MIVKLLNNENEIKQVVEIHMKVFKNFFLSFLGERFLEVMYREFFFDEDSGIIIASEEGKIVGFLAYSCNLSNLYKKMLRHNFITLGYLSSIAVIRKPNIVFRILRAFKYSKKALRKEKYVNLSSIGSLPNKKGVGSILINELKNTFYKKEYKYIKLETDKVDNVKVNHFYIKNKFILADSFVTPEGREMNEYRYYYEEGKNEDFIYS